MSQVTVGDSVKYVGDKDGSLRTGARGRVIEVGADIVTVDFGGSIGLLPIAASNLRKIG